MHVHVLMSLMHMASDLPEEDRRLVARAGIAYHIIHVKDGRTLISATLPDEALIATFKAYFDAKGRQCEVIGDWYEEGHRPGQTISYDQGGMPIASGTPTRPFNTEEFLARIPDKDDIGGRYIEAFQFIKPSGWGDWL